MKTKTYYKLENKKPNNFPEYLIVHHTGGTDKYPLMDTSHHKAKTVEEWHLLKGWIGIGYHYYIDKQGIVWYGRPEHVNGAHARGYNTKSLGVCLAGNFDATLPTQAQEDSLRELLLDLSQEYGINKDKIVPHRTFANKTCYGKLLSESWARDLLKEEMISIPRKLFMSLVSLLKQLSDKIKTAV